MAKICKISIQKKLFFLRSNLNPFINQNLFIMRKLLLFLALIMSIFFTAQAGYVIRGITAYVPPYNLKNYTLALNEYGRPVSAASIYTSWGGGMGRNSIVIIPADTLSPVFYFPVSFSSGGLEETYNIDVRDFHYISNGNKYVLCGARKTNNYSRAFVAVIDGGLNTMRYNEYKEADMFYSIWADNSNFSSLDYYVCGTSGARGVIASIEKTHLAITNCYVTAIDWEYHKIIAKQPGGSLRFVVSGRNPACTQIGFTIFTQSFSSNYSYAWAQTSEPNAHSVICDHVLANDKIIIASSHNKTVILNFVTIYTLTPTILVGVNGYSFQGTANTKYNVQDIGMFPITDAGNHHISVVGYIEDGTTLSKMAWHGYVSVVSSPSSTMNTNSYYTANEDYMHYKIKGNIQGDDFTGGYHQNGWQMNALFGTPLTIAQTCDYRTTNVTAMYGEPAWTTFSLLPKSFSESGYYTFDRYLYTTDYYACTPFKGAEPAPELLMPTEQEIEIITSHDHITVKDISTNTHYQIYSATGQLLQTGFTTSDISTAQLSKGLYILRLENGKAFKFVK